MPEGHTIHRIASDHRKHFHGQRLAASSPQGRFAHEASLITDTELLEIDAHGKHLFYHFAGGHILHIHLGLYGKFRLHRVAPDQLPEPRGQVRLRMAGNDSAFDLNGPNHCELLDDNEHLAIRDRLGEDPLRRDADPERVWDRVHRSRAAIGTLLLNQSVFAGVGNIYRSEVLHLLGIHPERLGQEIARAEFDELWEKLVELLTIGVKYNRIIIADPDEVGKTRGRMNRSERLLVYKKPACTICEGPIETWLLATRKVFACPVCQR